MTDDAPQTYRFRLSDREFARAWLTEYYRRPGWRLIRILGGPALVWLGLVMSRSADTFTRVMGIVSVAFGIYYALKPLLGAWMWVSHRRRQDRGSVEIELTLHDGGIRIDDGRVRTELPWSEISASGRTRRYVWYEIGRGGARGTIPLRVVDDPEALTRLLRERTKWQG